jgi:hypothetical protein
MTSNKETPDEFAMPRQAAEDTSTAASGNNDGETPARRTLVLHHSSAGSGNSSLTGDSSSTSTNRHIDRVLSDDDEDGIGELSTSVSSGPTYMARCPPSNGLVAADVEEDKKEEGDGGDSDIKGEDGEEFKEAAVEAMQEKIQAATDDSYGKET